jgi:Divergent InlB B-repeat domain
MISLRYGVLALVVGGLGVARDCTPHFSTATFSVSTLNFTPQVVSPGNSPSPAQPVKLTAGGNTALAISSFDASGEFSQTNNCPASLSPGNSCDLQVSYAPHSIGTLTGAITLSSNALGSPHIVNLSGTGLAPVGFSPASLDFGSVGVNTTSSAKTITLTNNQSSPLSITSVRVSGDYSQSNNCSSPLASGASCDISVLFKPTVATIVPGAVNVSTDAPLGTQPIRLVGMGTGSALSAVGLSSANLVFGNQEAGSISPKKTITLTNNGSTSLTIQSVVASNGYTSTDTCAGQMLSAGSTCSIDVTFQPKADFAPVDYWGAITIVDSDASSPQVIGLTGTGVSAVTSSPSVIDFGQILVNTTSAPQTVTLTNNDAATEGLTIAPSGGYALSNNKCGSTLASGATCKTDLTFTTVLSGGTGSGPLNGALTVVPASGGFLSPQVVSLRACATSVLVSPSRFNFGAASVGSSAAPETITVYSPINEFNVSAATVTGTNAADFTISNNTCATAQTSCTMDVTYAPQASGIRNATVTITDDDGCSPHQSALSGGSSAGPFNVYVDLAYSGADAVSSSPAGINCTTGGGTCAAAFASGTSVTLTAVPDSSPGSADYLSGWSNACSGTATCVLDMKSDKQVTANFAPDPVLTQVIAGFGEGVVKSTPAGVDCEIPITATTNCVASFPPGTSVTLTASAAPGSSFGGWSGAGCSGVASCTYTANAAETITATFNSLSPPDFSLSGTPFTPASITAGDSSTLTLSAASLYGFSTPVSLTCVVSPSPALAPECTSDPSSLTPGNSATITVNTIAPLRAGNLSLYRRVTYALWLPFFCIAFVGLRFAPKRYRTGQRYRLLLACLVLSAIAFHTSCGSSSPKSTGTPPGAYKVTVTGSSGSLQHAVQATLTVQ